MADRPWYLRPGYAEGGLVIGEDGSIQAATLPALIERLIINEIIDSDLVRTFLLTYKQFMTLDQLFEMLVQRFYIQPPDGLTPTELCGWKRLKQYFIQSRVLDIFETMLMDDGLFENSDMHILDRMDEFLKQEQVSVFAASKRVVGLIHSILTSRPDTPPEYVFPVTNKQTSLLSIDPMDLAQELTILESQLYQKIRPVECLARSRDENIHQRDSISRVIQVTNGIANWVVDAVLSQDSCKARAAFLKQFILVADGCRSKQNYSSVAAILSGLNSPPIRRLKRTWKQVNQQDLAQLDACERVIDSRNSFARYYSTLTNTVPPCVPFVGAFLATIASIQDGSDNILPGDMVNFCKCQEISSVMRDIQRWKASPHQLCSRRVVKTYVKESIRKFADQTGIDPSFRDLSFERELPETCVDQRTTRFPQDSGFL